MPKPIPLWKQGMRFYSVQAQIVAIAIAILTLTAAERPPLTWMLWLIIALLISAIILRFVAQPELYEAPFKETE